MPASTTPASLANQIGRIDLIDVRTPGEFAGVHATGAVNLPLDQVTPDAVAGMRRHDGPIYIICHSGARAAQAIATLEAAGLRDLVLVEGGTKAWQAAGAPVVTGSRRVLSLDRQLQLVVGTLVMAGTALGAFLNPWFLLIPAGVGAGLFNAGASGLCPLAMVIARMPWNRGSAPAACCTPAAG
ncbi:MAG: inner membrane protein YgaP [Planctomycetota bacterium]